MRRASKPNDPADSWRASAGTPCASVWRPGLPPRMRTPPQKLARHFKALVHRFPAQRIGVVGDLMLDRYLWGTATRLSPEAAVPLVAFVEQSECLGGAGDVAASLTELGARLVMLG